MVLGKRLGSRMKAAATAINVMEQAEIRKLEQLGTCEIVLNGEPIEISREEVEIRCNGR